MNTRQVGRQRTAVATTVIVAGSIIGLGFAVSAAASTIPALAGDSGSTVGTNQNSGGVQHGYGSTHARSSNS